MEDGFTTLRTQSAGREHVRESKEYLWLFRGSKKEGKIVEVFSDSLVSNKDILKAISNIHGVEITIIPRILANTRIMSLKTSTSADGVAITAIIKPILGFMEVKDNYISELAVEKTVTLSPRVLIKDLCRNVMEVYNLGHVADDFQVYIRHSNSEYYLLNTFFHDMNAEIGSVAPLFKDTLTIKIFVPLKFCECIKTVKADGVYENFIKYLISRMSDKKSQLRDEIIQYVRNEAKGCPIRQLPLETLTKMDEKLTHALQLNVTSMSEIVSPTPQKDCSLSIASVPRDNSISPRGVEPDDLKLCIDDLESIIGDSLTTSSSQENHKVVRLDAKPKKRVKYDKKVELPILEKWYGSSSSYVHDFTQYAEALNTVSGRIESNRLTSKNIRSWFERKRIRDKRDQKMLMS
uniref:Homeobox domain-containing protein n=1 Tax=Strongyloides venezuelensis TaxID=75913 RepID=A0A0K0FZY5_STRVS